MSSWEPPSPLSSLALLRILTSRHQQNLLWPLYMGKLRPRTMWTGQDPLSWGTAVSPVVATPPSFVNLWFDTMWFVLKWTNLVPVGTLSFRISRGIKGFSWAGYCSGPGTTHNNGNKVQSGSRWDLGLNSIWGEKYEAFVFLCRHSHSLTHSSSVHIRAFPIILRYPCTLT